MREKEISSLLGIRLNNFIDRAIENSRITARVAYITCLSLSLWLSHAIHRTTNMTNLPRLGKIQHVISCFARVAGRAWTN